MGVNLIVRWEILCRKDASEFIRDMDIDTDSSGVNKEIGYEIDLAIGYKISKKLKANITAGWFNPGDAFLEVDDPVYLRM
jgi:hypothetical protein